MKGVTASIATVPERERSLTSTLKSLAPQVERIEVHLNDGAPSPAIDEPKVRSYVRKEGRGDASRFYSPLEGDPDYLFFFDDDLVIPPDLVAHTISLIEGYDRKAIISYHGKVLPDRVDRDLYKLPFKKRVHCLNGQKKDTRVDIPGSGIMAFHRDTIELRPEDFPVANMADLWVADKAGRKGVPIIAAAHSSGWIRTAGKHDRDSTIYRRWRGRAKIATEVASQKRWGDIMALIRSGKMSYG